MGELAMRWAAALCVLPLLAVTAQGWEMPMPLDFVNARNTTDPRDERCFSWYEEDKNGETKPVWRLNTESDLLRKHAAGKYCCNMTDNKGVDVGVDGRPMNNSKANCEKWAACPLKKRFHNAWTPTWPIAMKYASCKSCLHPGRNGVRNGMY